MAAGAWREGKKGEMVKRVSYWVTGCGLLGVGVDLGVDLVVGVGVGLTSGTGTPSGGGGREGDGEGEGGRTMCLDGHIGRR